MFATNQRVYYSGPVILGDFYIIPFLTNLYLTDTWTPHLKGGLRPLNPAPIPRNIWPLTASIGMISKPSQMTGPL